MRKEKKKRRTREEIAIDTARAIAETLSSLATDCADIEYALISLADEFYGLSFNIEEKQNERIHHDKQTGRLTL